MQVHLVPKPVQNTESRFEVIQGHAFWDHWKADDGQRITCTVSEILQVFALMTPPLFDPNFGSVPVAPDRPRQNYSFKVKHYRWQWCRLNFCNKLKVFHNFHQISNGDWISLHVQNVCACTSDRERSIRNCFTRSLRITRTGQVLVQCHCERAALVSSYH